MTMPISDRTRIASLKTVKTPNIVLCLDGLDQCFGSSDIKTPIKIGDPGLLIDGSWLIGGVESLENQLTSITLDSTTTSIKQALDIDKAKGSSIQSMNINMIDIQNKVSKLVSPGVVLDDVLGRKAIVYLALDVNTSLWPVDYSILFRGIVEDTNAQQGSVQMSIAHPDQKKRQNVFPRVETNLVGAITDSQTTIDLLDASDLLLPVAGPSGATDFSFLAYILVDDEIIQYTGISGNQLTGCVRNSLGTFPAAHDDEKQVFSFYRLQGTVMDLALKFMLSKGGFWQEDAEISSFQVAPGPTSLPNTLIFLDVDVTQLYGLSVGDFVTTTGALNGANNVSLKEVSSISLDNGNSLVEIDGVSFVDEDGTSGLVSFRSQYDSLPDGLGMGGDEVDVPQHEELKRLFLSSFNYDFYLKDNIDNAKEYLEQQIYKPAGCYGVPRRAAASVQIHVGPIPGSNIPTLSKSNITNPSKLVMNRSINKNMFNTIVYKFEMDTLEDKFLRGVITKNVTSSTQIPIGTRALVIESEGLREALLGKTLAISASEKRLNRYAFAAEYINGIKLLFGVGFSIEVGDIVILDSTDLNIINISNGSRDKPPGLFEVVNKTLNYKTGEVTVDLVDTKFDGSARYGLIGPASIIKSGISQTQFIIEPSFSSRFGSAEYQKWQRYEDVAIKVRSPDGTTRNASTIITQANSNTIKVRDALGFIPLSGDILELAQYDFVDTTVQIKLIYSHMRDSTFADGEPQFVML